jgi:putative redox protein
LEVSARLRWKEELKFSAEAGEDRQIELNSADEMGQAYTPMELFLLSLAGCTAMDVQWIMSRERQEVKTFEISVSGKRRDEDPTYFETIDLDYIIGGENIRKSAIERAIRLSQEKYCPVRAMLKDNVKFNIHYTVINGKNAPQKFNYPSS